LPPALIAGIPRLQQGVMKYQWEVYTSALTISFAYIIGGQHAVDKFLWRRELLVTLNRDSQKWLEKKGKNHLPQ
jgi:hypothetical protein